MLCGNLNGKETQIQKSYMYMYWRWKWQQLQYSCLGNPMDRGARQATVHGVAEELDMN